MSPAARGALTSFTRAWYTQESLRELVLIYPVYAIMIGEAGVSPLELSVLLAAWSATGLALEVPSGTLADRMPRRAILVAGQLFKAGGFLLWWWMPSFWGFLAGFVAWGTGGSLRSGAAEALLHDKLREFGRPDLFVRIYGRSEGVNAASVVLAMSLGGWAAVNGFALPLGLSVAASLAAAGVILMFIREPSRSAEAATHEPYLATLAAGLGEVRSATTLRRPILYLCTAALAYEVGEEYFGPLLDEAGFSLVAVGVVTALTHLARAGGAFSAQWQDRVVGGRMSLLYGAAGILLAAAALSPRWTAVAALALFAALSAGAKVLLQGRLQRAIEGHARATITSVAHFGQSAASVPLFIAIGAVAARKGWTTSLALLGGGLFLVAVLLGLRLRGGSSPGGP